MKNKLAYVSEVTSEEVKRFTCYDKYKDTIDAITGRDNLDFPFKHAEVNEFEIKLTLEDGNIIFLPIIESDGQGYRHDRQKEYSTIHRPETEEEVKRKKAEERRKAKLAKQAEEEAKERKAKKEAKKEGEKDEKREENKEENKPEDKTKGNK